MKKSKRIKNRPLRMLAFFILSPYFICQTVDVSICFEEFKELFWRAWEK